MTNQTHDSSRSTWDENIDPSADRHYGSTDLLPRLLSRDAPQSRSIGPEDILYRINTRDEIVYINTQWQRFAAENTPPGSDAKLTPDQVIGRSLWTFITDRTTREIYQVIVKRVRAREIVHFSFRCDSPDCRRLLQMDITALPDGSVEFHTFPLYVESRLSQPLLEHATPRGDSLMLMCSWCNRVRVDTGWVEIEVAVAEEALFEEEMLPALSHGICDDCFAAMQRFSTETDTPAT